MTMTTIPTASGELPHPDVPMLSIFHQQLYSHVCAFLRIRRRSPALRELAKLMQCSKWCISKHLDELESLGLLERKGQSRARVIKLT